MDPQAAEKLELRIRVLEGWAREHDGKINAKWDAQVAEDARCERDRTEIRTHMEQNFGMVFRKLNNIEVKLAAFCALASLLGGSLAKFLPW